MTVIPEIENMQREAVLWRHEFHANPELRFDLPRTSARVADLLRSFGCDEVTQGVGQSGVVAVIKGREPGNRSIGLRADMDALPISEMTNVPYSSGISGKMHACGHDGHTTMLLMAARHLAQSRAFSGSAVLIFQPAEEDGGGAKAMIADGLFNRWPVDEVYALHNMPAMAVGSFAIRPGPLMAAADMFEIRLLGQGGHAAQPHLCVDSVMAAGHVLVALQTLVARSVDPLQSAVVSVGKLSTDSAGACVLPGVVTLNGTVRSFVPSVQDLLEDRLCTLVRGIAQTHGATAEIRYDREAKATVNAPDQTRFAVSVARTLSSEVDETTPQVMVSEDFSEMLALRPGAFIFIGNGPSAPLHHPAYDFNDSALPFGASWLAGLVMAR